MASIEYYQTPIYNCARLLYVQLAESTHKVPKDVRYDFLAGLKNKVLYLMQTLSLAWELPQERLKELERGRRQLKEVEVGVRMLKDLNYIPVKGYRAIVAKEGNVEKQLSGWLLSERKKLGLPNEEYEIKEDINIYELKANQRDEESPC